MLKNYLFVLIGLISLSALAQDVESKVVWNSSYDANDQKLTFEATLSEGWHVYSQFTDASVGPVPTSFTFEKAKGVKLVGETEEPTPIQKFDPNFDGQVSYFEEKVVFKQEISVRKNSEVSGTITFMVCNETMCLPPDDKRFIITINK